MLAGKIAERLTRRNNMNHPLPNTNGALERNFVVSQIAKLRQEWQETVGEGVNLDHIKGSVGMILDDICHALDLSSQEIQEAVS